ncbi:MAG: O-antigen ligase family protein [Thermoleophilia bacterium]
MPSPAGGGPAAPGGFRERVRWRTSVRPRTGADALDPSTSRVPAWTVPAIAVATAAAVALPARLHGAFGIGVWAPLGIAVALVVAAALAAGARPPRLLALAAGASALLGCWAVASTAWDGLPTVAWETLGQAVLAAAALLAGSLVARTQRQRDAVLAGILLGVTAHAGEILARVAIDGPGDWFVDRALEGPVGYHNAQAALLALGVPLALVAWGSRHRLVRMAGAASGGLVLGALLLAQSRGGVIAAAAGIAIVLVWARRLALAVAAVPLVVAALALTRALPRLDRALVDGTIAEQHDALQAVALWSLLAAAVLAALAVVRPPARIPAGRARTVAVVAGAAVLVVGAVGLATVGRGPISRAVDSVTSDANPNEGAAGTTRLSTLSLSGRRMVWDVAADLTAEHPVVGAGIGQFARAWTVERTNLNLYVLHAHSIELELLGELGAIGLLLFAAMIVLALVAAARGPSRTTAAAALGLLAVVVLQASIDWTWSFPAIVAPMLLAVGAAAGAGPARGARPLGIAVASSGLAAAVLVIGGLWLATASSGRAEAALGDAPRAAWSDAADALRVNPWDATALSVQGRVAAEAGDLELARARLLEAADRSQRPWFEWYVLARAYGQADRQAEAEAACDTARSLNPIAPELQSCGLADFFEG